MVNSLAQSLIKVTAPGVPDVYQGSEVWDFSLVDPDNRRPVDFAARASLLEKLRARISAGPLASLARELVDRWEDGGIKLYTLHRALSCRRAASGLFLEGDYVPLRTRGPRAGHLCAFARRHRGQMVVSVVPRLTARLTDKGAMLPLGSQVWHDTWVELPVGSSPGPLQDVFTDSVLEPVHGGDGGLALAVPALLAEFPVALLAGPPLPPRAAVN
jgi:(1->4)-alpha-D-glucan 1-alpha-D-glucosylmutase